LGQAQVLGETLGLGVVHGLVEPGQVLLELGHDLVLYQPLGVAHVVVLDQGQQVEHLLVVGQGDSPGGLVGVAQVDQENVQEHTQ